MSQNRQKVLCMTKQKEFAQTQVRMPTEVHEQIKESADRNFRSLNAEILYLLQIALEHSAPHATPKEVRTIVREELDRKTGKT